MLTGKRSSDGAELGGDDYSRSSKKHRSDDMASSSSSQPSEIDEDLYSHHLAVYGHEAMRRFISSNILISGMQGLGVEIAKNLILAGVKSVTLHDEGNVEMWDFSGSYIFSEENLGHNRAVVSKSKLQQLNNSVRISTSTAKVTGDYLNDFQVVVFTDISLEQAIEFDDYCHHHQPPIAFIKSEVRGLFGSIYCDFGPEFTVFDVDGKEPHTSIISSISNDNPALVTCAKGHDMSVSKGDLVVFSDVRGMTELNDGKPRKIIDAKYYAFTIEEDTTKYTAYERGGFVTQLRESKVLNFKPLRQALKNPGNFVESDLLKSPALLHLAFQALDMFKIKWGHLPSAASENDAQELISLFTGINNDLDSSGLENVDEKLLRDLASGSRAVLIPMASVFGGIVGQEVVKACSGKFHPIFQFFYFDSAESLPVESLDPDDLKPLGCRYDAQISVFGSKLQTKLEAAKVFIVGSGATGCEFLKNFALMGVCCGERGALTMTDKDVIEKRDLSRQFMFRDSNISQAKSIVDASAAYSINSQLRFKALQESVNPATENLFHDTFWKNLKVVIAALGNANTKHYLVQRCLYFRKALLTSETLGTECSSQLMIPFLTDELAPGSSMDPYEKEPPTGGQIMFFPHNISHCLRWARTEFRHLLEETPTNVNDYLSNPTEFVSHIQNVSPMRAVIILERVLDCLDKEGLYTFESCIVWARLKFESYFANKIERVIEDYPKDFVTTDGDLFWSPPRLFPHPMLFSNKDSSHLNFVIAAAILRAETLGIHIPDGATSLENLTKSLDKVTLSKFQSLDSESEEDSTEIEKLVEAIENCRKKLPPDFKMNSIKFEKDDVTNHHMDLISSLANLRARNYGIPEVDRLKAKFTVERIIPKVATSAAVATGLVCLELYKLLGGINIYEKYRDGYANLARPFFRMPLPFQLVDIEHEDMTWTIWDRWVMKNNPTVTQLIEVLEDKGLYVNRITCQGYLVYDFSDIEHEERLDRTLFDLVNDSPDVVLPRNRLHFDVSVKCENHIGKDVDHIPLISIFFNMSFYN